MSNPYGGTTDTEWALGVPLDRLQHLSTAHLAIRYLREEVERLQVVITRYETGAQQILAAIEPEVNR